MVIMKCIGSKQFYLEKVIMPSEIYLLMHLRKLALKFGACRCLVRCCTYAQMSVTTKRLRVIQTLRN